MLGAVVVTFVGYRYVLRRLKPLLTERFFVPTLKDIDGKLVIGAGLFGISWGLSGFCPGPAITSLPLLAKGTLIFVPAMIVGISLARLLTQANVPGHSIFAASKQD